MRKSFNGLSGVVIDIVDQDPQSGHLFLFFNRRRSMMKALVWERTGYWVLSKRLNGGRFEIFDRASREKNSFELSSCDLALLLDGIDLRGAKRNRAISGTEALLDS
jgi:transposase